ncbi:hypothetical protein BEWA_000420 [Theileria equi strain WA]|uniref:Uncharacterized protein n=1 Tax=Theileria equi strain WA TaxID=1537102 RepID=L0AYG8_THEEQ|nr:hypothetical protein BEWA_000420 [Theileria equi strain WA]AFZ80637.1 hypothetical protein BEWA_000420 [Theileria equi strain WA]|eukprot:XP_004830303.1 hypothetical protein BEWA_000420 [Theileria equi strain WA]
MNSLKSSKAVDPLDNLYFREKNKSENKGASGSVDTSAYKCDVLTENLAYELRQLDASLDELFLTRCDLDSFQGIHKFRVRVSRRISSFSSILKTLARQCDAVSNSNQRVKLFTLYQFYNERLMRHKNNLSEWWSKNERHYHTLCLSSFVSNNSKLSEEEEPIDMSEEQVYEKDEIVTKKLKDTKNMMISQINQMDAAEISLLKSSDYITQQQAFLKVLKGKFNTATVLFNAIKRNTMKRYGIVRCCYFVFISSCSFIALRRFRAFKLARLVSFNLSH